MARETLPTEKSEFLKEFIQGGEIVSNHGVHQDFDQKNREQPGPYWKVEKKSRPSEFVLKFFIELPNKTLGI